MTCFPYNLINSPTPLFLDMDKRIFFRQLHNWNANSSEKKFILKLKIDSRLRKWIKREWIFPISSPPRIL